MAENNVGVDTSVYRQPPQQNPLAMLTQIGQAADSLGNIAVGQGVQQAIDPDTGDIDRNKLAQLLKGSVAGSMKAIPTLDALEKLRSAGFGADQQGLETFQKRMAITNHLFSGLASKGKINLQTGRLEGGPTIDDVYDVATKAMDPLLDAKKYGITLPVIMNALKGFRGPDGKPLPSDKIKEKALEIQTHAAATSEILHQHSPQVRVIDDNGNIRFEEGGTASRPQTGVTYSKDLPPTTPVATKGGQLYLGTRPVQPPVRSSISPDRPEPISAAPGAAPVAPRPVPTMDITPRGPAATNRPGYNEAAVSQASAGAASANALAAANDSSMARKAILGNLDDMMTRFTTGVGADWTRVAKNFANRNLPIPEQWQQAGGVFDPKSIASQEEFNKQAMQLAQAQFATIGGTGTDAKFSSAFETSPNELLSQMGNKNIIKLLKGNEDAIQAKNKAWLVYKKEHGPDTHQEFTADFNAKFDPRVFQFKYLTVPERTAYVQNMEPGERERFLHDLTHARLSKWIDFGVK